MTEGMAAEFVRLRGNRIALRTRLVSELLPTVFFFHGAMANMQQFAGLWAIANVNIVAYDALGAAIYDLKSFTVVGILDLY